MKKLHGVIESISNNIVQGWVLPQNFDCPFEEIELSANLNGAIVGRGFPSRFRQEFGKSCAYTIICNQQISPAIFFSGQFHILARHKNIENNLVTTSTVRTRFLADLIKENLLDASHADLSFLVKTLQQLPATSTENFIEKNNTLDRIAVQNILKEISNPNKSKRETTLLPVEVGYVAPDGSALIGREGEAFLVLGTNQLLRQFITNRNDPTAKSLALEWIRLIGERFHAAKNLEIEFLQVIVPEKLSFYPERFPGSINTPSTILHNIEIDMQNTPCYISAYQALTPLKTSTSLYPRFDTHLTVPAAYQLFSICLERFGLKPPFQLNLSDEIELKGDLSNRFFDFPLRESLWTLSPNVIQALSESLEVVERVDDGKKHVGTRYVWRNKSAPYDLKVVAFANSFFERGGSPRTLTWWFQRAFREFHFLWSPDLDMSYVRKIRPDLLICQTIERFLGRVPNDKFAE